MKRLVIGIVLILLVIVILLTGITFIGILPLLIFEESLSRTINNLTDSIINE